MQGDQTDSWEGNEVEEMLRLINLPKPENQVDRANCNSAICLCALWKIPFENGYKINPDHKRPQRCLLTI